MPNYELFIKYGTDKHYTRIADEKATGPMHQVLAYLSVNVRFIMSLSDNGEIKIKIRPVK